MTGKGRDPKDRTEADIALDREDEALVAALRGVTRAPERTAARNAAFDARLAEKVAGGRGAIPWLGALVGATAAAALAFLFFGGVGGESPVARNEAAASALEEALVALSYGDAYDAGDGAADVEAEGGLDESLPKEYVAIESLFLGG